LAILSFILQIVLGVGFLNFGYAKFSSPQMVEGFKHFGYPKWFRLFTGSVEIIAALLILIGLWKSIFAAIGGFLIIATMIGAIFTHIKIKDTLKGMMMPIILLILGSTVLLINFPDLFG